MSPEKKKYFSFLVKCPISVPNFNKIWISSKYFHQVPEIKFQGNPYSGSRADACGHDEASGGAFRDYANTPTKER
jgi:hypothetical protein